MIARNTLIIFFTIVACFKSQSQKAVTKIVASDRFPNDQAGWSMSVWEDYCVMGVPNKNVKFQDKMTASAGSAYIFKKQNGNWKLHAKLYSDTIKPSNFFGCNVIIKDSFLLIGADGEHFGAPTKSAINRNGAVYIYKLRPKGQWVQIQKITLPSGKAEDLFGHTLSFNKGTLCVAAPGKSNITGQGSVFIYKKDGETFFYSSEIECPDKSKDFFGKSIMSSTTHLAIGGRFEGVYLYSLERENPVLETSLLHQSMHSRALDRTLH